LVTLILLFTQDVSIVDASEDDQIAAAIQASLVETTKTSAASASNSRSRNVYDSDSDLVKILPVKLKKIT
jgi:hypothetical protein